MAPDRILQVRNVLIYPAVVGNNLIPTIIQALTMSTDHIFQVSDVLIYLDVIGKNIIHKIGQDLNNICQTRYVQRTSYNMDSST